MANLNGLKNRIGVVNNTRKITHAMELVAASKLRKYKQEYENVQAYQNTLESTFSELLEQLNPTELKIILPDLKGIKSKAYIVITSDLGLCGSYNSNIINLLKEKVNPEDKLIVFGSKGIATLLCNNKLKDTIISQYADYGQNITYAEANEAAKEALELLLNQEVCEINVVYTKFINNVVQEAKIKKLLPFEQKTRTDDTDTSKKAKATFEFEPSAQVVLQKAIPLYVSSLVYALGASSKVSEMASRRNAMENATDNAQDLLESLHLEYNSTRQSLITQEINEIVSGADAT